MTGEGDLAIRNWNKDRRKKEKILSTEVRGQKKKKEKRKNRRLYSAYLTGNKIFLK